MLTEIELGREANAYIREWLEVGNTLSKELLKFDIEQGKATAAVPEGVSADQAVTRLRAGDLLNPEESGSYLVSRLMSHLQERDDACVLFDDWEASPQDPFLRQAPSTSRILLVGEEVYHGLTSSELSREVVDACILGTAGMPLIGALSIGPLPGPGVVHLGSELLIEIARSTVQIVVSAFDWEGYIFWSRPQ